MRRDPNSRMSAGAGLALAILAAALVTGCTTIMTRPAAMETERQYLSGHGPTDAVAWEFYCTGGRKSGQWTTIPVPSNWEQQGFGSYNYGHEVPKADEQGKYRFKFRVPAGWDGRRIRLAFDGVMTDAAVRVNGQSAGPAHQGGFYRFKYDVTDLLKLDEENLLEVDVSKVSANPTVEEAERKADYWVFGGIYRPVFLEALPTEFIDWTAIDARADGSFAADVHLARVKTADNVVARILTSDNQPVGEPFEAPIGENTEKVVVETRVTNPLLWTAETPNLYKVEFTLRRGSRPIHTVTERFGFRTFEVREGRGLFLNGRRVVMKGVDRHSFRPETGRCLSREDCYQDLRTIQSMNMNAARMSHYPPDAAFLEACDELGLYVLDELAGWQKPPYDTEVGKKLVREMLVRDVNYPCILFWDNGNEGGWNKDLDGEFAKYDRQRRRVLHPWDLFGGVNTKHYPAYNVLKGLLEGPDVVMPTELLHGLYDGGHGTALDDYWKLMKASPVGGGGFLWNLADEGVARTDQDGRLDVFATYAPDGILGPHHEREGSYHTIREVFSPVQIDRGRLPADFDGTFNLKNEYAFTNLNQCRFAWQVVRFRAPADESVKNEVIQKGEVAGPAVAPGESGRIKLDLPKDWNVCDALLLTAFGPGGEKLWTWTWDLRRPADYRERLEKDQNAKVKIDAARDELRLSAGDLAARFDPKTGQLLGIKKGERVIDFAHGPRLACARPLDDKKTQWLKIGKAVASSPDTQNPAQNAFDEDAKTIWTGKAGAWIRGDLAAPQMANAFKVEMPVDKESLWTGYKAEISSDGERWTTVFDAALRDKDGDRFDFPPQPVRSIRLTAGERCPSAPLQLAALRLGRDPGRFGDETKPQRAVKVTWETNSDGARINADGAGGFDRLRWTLHPNGLLQLDYAYSLKGDFEYHGVTFDYPEARVRGMKWLGEGPYRVWKNRMKGTWLGVHETAYNDNPPGKSWIYPDSKGYFAGLRWVRLETDQGPLTVATDTEGLFLRTWTPKPSHRNTSPDFPAGDLSFLHAIPPIGEKFRVAADLGPSGQWNKADGAFEGTLYFRFR